MREEEIIIVGAGLSGLGCAKRLFENGKKFKIISEDIGGRVLTSPDGDVNYGAYYITEDCRNIKPYVESVRIMDLGDYHFHENGKDYHLSLWNMMRHGSALLRLWSDLREFRKHFNAMRVRSLDESREKLIEAAPVLCKYYHGKAGDYIKERGLEKLTREFLEQALWGSFFVDCRTVPTFIFLQCLIPMIVPTYSFKMNFPKIMAGFDDAFVKDSVLGISKTGDGFELNAKSGDVYRAKRLVLATPMTVTNKLIAPQKIKGTINCSFMHVRGKIKPQYDVRGYNFFGLTEKAAISKETDGTFLYFYTKGNKISQYFDSWQVITAKSWDPALMLLGDDYVNHNPAPGLYLANDHDVASTEDAFISGMQIGKLIL